MPSSEHKYLNFGCKNVARCCKEGLHPKYRKWGDSWECSFGNQLNAAVVYGSCWSHSKMLSIENLHIPSLRNQWDYSNFPFDWGGGGKYRFSLYQVVGLNVQYILM